MNVYRCRICGEVYIGKEKPNSCPFCGAHQTYLVLAGEWTLLQAKSLSAVSRDNLTKSLDLEIDNTNFYRSVSERTKDTFIQSMFKGLSKVEREHLLNKLSSLSQQIITCVKDEGSLKVADLERLTKANRNTIKAHLKDLINSGHLEKVGQGKGTSYILPSIY